MAQKKVKSRKQNSVSKKSAEVIEFFYSITHNPLPDPVYAQLPPAIQDEFAMIYEQLVSPSSMAQNYIPRLEELVALYPEQPKIANFLVAAYQRVRHPQLEEMIYKNYLKHPTYLFARLHYAESCLHRLDFNKVIDIFKEGFHLRLLYPERECFHIIEFVNFTWLIFRYFIMKGDKQAAKSVLQELEKVAPCHPFTLEAQRILNATSFNSSNGTENHAAHNKKEFQFKA